MSLKSTKDPIFDYIEKLWPLNKLYIWSNTFRIFGGKLCVTFPFDLTTSGEFSSHFDSYLWEWKLRKILSFPELDKIESISCSHSFGYHDSFF